MSDSDYSDEEFEDYEDDDFEDFDESPKKSPSRQASGLKVSILELEWFSVMRYWSRLARCHRQPVKCIDKTYFSSG